VQDNTQEGIVDVDLSVVLDEAQFPEFVHEEIDMGARCPDHFRQSLLRHFGDHFMRLVLLAIGVGSWFGTINLHAALEISAILNTDPSRYNIAYH
jgi:hypothetical protein